MPLDEKITGLEATNHPESIYVIDPAKCTECVGAHDEPQCKLVCPADCIVVNPDFQETPEQLQETTMSPLLGIALAVAGLLLAAALIYGLAKAWRRALHDDARLPFFDMIERHGTTREELAAVLSFENLALAVRRCTFCGSKEQCRARLAARSAAVPPANCPNVRFFDEFGLRVDQTRA